MARISPRQRRESFPHPDDSGPKALVAVYCIKFLSAKARGRGAKIGENAKA